MRTIVQMGLVVLVQAAVTVPALAQTGPDPDVAIDRAEARVDRGVDADIASATPLATVFSSTGEPIATTTDKPQLWTLKAETAFAYSDNVNLAETGKLDAAHSTTYVSLTRVVPLSARTSLALTARSDIDVLTDHTELGTSWWTANAKLSFGKPTDALTPYIQATSVGLYQDVFGKHIVSTHLYGVGAERKLVFGENHYLLVDFNLMRREASIVTTELNRAHLQLTYVAPAANELTWSLVGRLRYSDYTGGTAASREDVQLRLALGLTWKIGPALDLNTNLVIVKNWSNLPGKSHANIDVGPSLTFVTKF